MNEPTPLELAIKAEQEYRQAHRLAPFATHPDVTAIKAIKRPLQYVHHTDGHASLEHFKEDHEPIGTQLWVSMYGLGVVRINETGCIVLTDIGRIYLAEMS